MTYKWHLIRDINNVEFPHYLTNYFKGVVVQYSFKNTSTFQNIKTEVFSNADRISQNIVIGHGVGGEIVRFIAENDDKNVFCGYVSICSSLENMAANILFNSMLLLDNSGLTETQYEALCENIQRPKFTVNKLKRKFYMFANKQKDDFCHFQNFTRLVEKLNYDKYINTSAVPIPNDFEESMNEFQLNFTDEIDPNVLEAMKNHFFWLGYKGANFIAEEILYFVSGIPEKQL